MNYRHIFHAGNICDTVKHAVLTLAIGALRVKDKPFAVIDTHAGAGLYDLGDERARKTGEAQAGIYRLLAAAPLVELEDYYSTVREFNPNGDVSTPETFRFYPGSPIIARRLLRPQDRLVLCELHAEDARELRRRFRNDRQAQVHCRDGYEALEALVPPAEKRGLVLIDPPFEQPEEFARLATAAHAAHRKWPQGVMMLWYPVKDRPAIWRFHEALAGLPETLNAEFVYEDETQQDRLRGCGFVFINPPWTMDVQLRALLPRLHAALATNVKGAKVEWLGHNAV